MQPMAGDECILMFAGEDKTSPYCLPCSVSAPGAVSLRHGVCHVTVGPSAIFVQTKAATVAVGQSSVSVTAGTINLTGNVVVSGNLAVAGVMTNSGKNIGAGHRHSNGTAHDGNTGVVV
jgi:phage baseplate assembly protein gpV|nr:MAG TPA: puncturing protein [Caudoviricetes sp.]